MPTIRPDTRGTAGWTGGMNTMAEYLMNRPRMQAAARQQVARQQLMQQQAREHGAKTELLAQQLNDLKISADDRDALKDAVTKASPLIAAGKTDAPEVNEYYGLIAKIAAQNKGHPAAELITAMGKPQPNTQYVADKRAESSKYSADTRSQTSKDVAEKNNAEKLAAAGLHPFRSVNSGGAVMDARTGQLVAHNPSANAGNAANLTDEVKYDIPEQAAKDATPEVPARPGFMGIGARPGVPAEPAVPGHPVFHVTRKVPRGTSDEKILAAPLAQAFANTGVNVRPEAPPGEGSEETNPDVQPTEQAAPAPVATAPAEATAPAPAPAAATPSPAQLPDGSIIRHKKSGQQFVIKNGQPVPLEAPPVDSGD